MVQEFMRNIVRQIALLDLETMQAIQDEARQSQQHWDSVGGIVDPTAYRNMLYTGAIDHARKQSEIVDHLIAIRALVSDMDVIAQKNIKRRTIDSGESVE